MSKLAAGPSVQAVTQHPLQSPTHLPPDAQSAEAASLPQASPEEVAPDAQPGEASAPQVQEPNASLPSAGQYTSTGTSAADAAFAAWLSAADHAEWAVVEYLANQALPLLIKALRMVAPQTETEAVRYTGVFTFMTSCNHLYEYAEMLGRTMQESQMYSTSALTYTSIAFSFTHYLQLQ